MNTHIESSAIVEPGASVGKGARIWHFSHIRTGAILGDLVSIGRDCYVDSGVEVERGARIQNGVSVYRGVHLGPWTFIGPAVVFTNDLRPRAGVRKWSISETFIHAGASLGAGTVLICGCSVGSFALVGAGSTVLASIPAFHLAVGNPSHIISKICACGSTKLPLSSGSSEVIRECCRDTLIDEVYELAVSCSRNLTF